MKGKETRGSIKTSERGRELRRLQTVPPRTLHRLREVVLHGRRPCLPDGCVKRHVCPCASRREEDRPDHCLALEAHLGAYKRSLRRVVDGPVDGHLLGIILRREELIALGQWFLSETSPFYLENGQAVAAGVLDQYHKLLSAQSRDLLALRARGFSRPAPDAVFAQALQAAIDATPGHEDAPVSLQDGPSCDEDANG